MTFSMIVLEVVLLLLMGVLIGGTLTEQALQARARRQAAMQRSLNRQWQELESQWRELEVARQKIPQQRKGELPTRPTAMTTSGSATRR
jgi:uncharacterized membrane-anchored protein YhcB (DUF1043 family)